MVSATVTQFVGLYVLIVSVVYLVRRDAFKAFAYDFVENRELRYVVSFLELAVGLGIVLFHTGWATVADTLITIFGWMMVAESVFFLVASEEHGRRLIRFLDHDWYWIGGGVLAILIGLYLTAAGFGLL